MYLRVVTGEPFPLFLLFFSIYIYHCLPVNARNGVKLAHREIHVCFNCLFSFPLWKARHALRTVSRSECNTFSRFLKLMSKCHPATFTFSIIYGLLSNCCSPRAELQKTDLTIAKDTNIKYKTLVFKQVTGKLWPQYIKKEQR